MTGTENLERLWAMRQAGAINDAEYATLKAQALGDAAQPVGTTTATPATPNPSTSNERSQRATLDQIDANVRTGSPAKIRKISLPLAAAIVFAPFVGVWFLLRTGHTTLSRVAGFSWLAVFAIVAVSAPKSGGPASKTTEAKSPNSKIPAAVQFHYTEKTDPEFLKQLGRKGFEQASALNRGAFLATAESAQCDKAIASFLGEDATAKNLFWFVDCNNENRFRVSAAQARMALAREKNPSAVDGKVPPVTSPACTFRNVAACSHTDDQKQFVQGRAVTACDEVLARAVLSLPSLKKAWTWDYGMTKPNRVVVERDFESSNAFGAMLSSRYRCEIDAALGGVRSFTIRRANGGWEKII